jgi:hypothetical protein
MNQDISKYEIVHDEYHYLQKAIKNKRQEFHFDINVEFCRNILKALLYRKFIMNNRLL